MIGEYTRHSQARSKRVYGGRLVLSLVRLLIDCIIQSLCGRSILQNRIQVTTSKWLLKAKHTGLCLIHGLSFIVFIWTSLII